MDREAWQATVQESDMTQQLKHHHLFSQQENLILPLKERKESLGFFTKCLRCLTRSLFCQISNTSQSCVSYRKCSIHKLLTIVFFFCSFFFPDYLESYLQMPTSGLCNNSKEHLCRFDSYFSVYLPLINTFLFQLTHTLISVSAVSQNQFSA